MARRRETAARAIPRLTDDDLALLFTIGEDYARLLGIPARLVDVAAAWPAHRRDVWRDTITGRVPAAALALDGFPALRVAAELPRELDILSSHPDESERFRRWATTAHRNDRRTLTAWGRTPGAEDVRDVAALLLADLDALAAALNSVADLAARRGEGDLDADPRGPWRGYQTATAGTYGDRLGRATA